MKRLLPYILLSLFVLSCGGGDDSPEQIDDTIDVVDDGPVGQDDDDSTSNEPVSVVLNLDGITELDLATFEAVTINNTIPISDDNSFNVPSIDNTNEFPIIFMKGGQMLFGYYHDNDKDEITNEDILFYYIALFPEFLTQAIDNAEIKNVLTNHGSKDELLQIMVQSLNQEKSPFLDMRFAELYSSMIMEILGDSGNSISNARENQSKFAIEYSRDGRITYPTQSPLFAYLGVEIEDSSGEYLSRALLSNRTVDLISLLSEKLGIELTDEYLYEDQLVEEGSYAVNISNGNFEEFDYVAKANSRAFALRILTLGLSQFFKVFSQVDGECAIAFKTWYGSISSEVVEFMEVVKSSGPQTDWKLEFFKLFKNLGLSFLDLVPCANAGTLGYATFTFLAQIFETATVIFEVTDVAFWIRDAIASDIYFEEQVHFDGNDKLLYGNLNVSNITPLKVSDLEDSYKYHSAYYEEMYTEYFVNIGLVESSFERNDEYLPVEGLPFYVEVEGDVQIENNEENFETGEDGNLLVNYQLKKEDSKINLVPNFYYPEDVSQTIEISVDPCEDTACQEQKFREWLLSREFKLLTIDDENLCSWTQTTQNNGESPTTETGNTCPGNGTEFTITFNEDGSWD